MSTKATGKIIYALTDYLTRTGESSPDYTMTVTLNGKQIKKTRITKSTMLSEAGRITIPEGDLKVGPTPSRSPRTVREPLLLVGLYLLHRGDSIAPKNGGFDVKRNTTSSSGWRRRRADLRQGVADRPR